MKEIYKIYRVRPDTQEVFLPYQENGTYPMYSLAKKKLTGVPIHHAQNKEPAVSFEEVVKRLRAGTHCIRLKGEKTGDTAVLRPSSVRIEELGLKTPDISSEPLLFSKENANALRSPHLRIDAQKSKVYDAGRGVKLKEGPQMTDTPIADIASSQPPFEPTEQEGLLEQEPDNTPLEIPPDKRRVKTDKQDVPIETLHLRIKKGRLDIQPEFQRYYVWSPPKASKLIESILLEIPIPVVYLAEEQDNRQSVVDGQQRLTSIIAFLDGLFPGPDKATFKLTSLQVLKELNGLTFKDLDAAMQEKILGTALRLVVIEKDSDPDVKFEVFERLNVGAVALNDQELRNCVYRGTYNKLLRDLSHNEHLLKVLRQDYPHPRMQDRQLILRLLAMWRKTHLKYKSPMKQFLNHEMEENKNANPEAIEEMREVFTRSIEMAYAVFGQNAFRRYYPGTQQEPNGSWEPKKLNIALWDTILYGLSYFEKTQIIPIADAIREEFLDLMCSDDQFVKFITSTTDQPDRVQYRADIWIKRMRELVGYKGPEPRTFSLALKQKLYEANPACAICGQHMHDVDDTEVDHIVHYWRGGATSLDNARLTHRFCNRQRGSRE